MLGGAIITTLAGREKDIEQGLISAEMVANTGGIESAALQVLYGSEKGREALWNYV
ncbi:hypothetical protein OCA8868_02094 [Octadecabacter ascidiaceicola]|uniref:Uncharacterized protein n=1 Tax=Octadecabacter ascidiaceicola TaxID=1655543 RepID=A0A238KA74_9RHOB|nr:hypothetical protein OCA8868_02094 [Octadecabacter ascidiaceicola]